MAGTSGARIRITRVLGEGDIARQIEPKMRNLGNAMARRMQRLVPKRSWDLHNTIETGTERRGNKVVTQVGAGSSTVTYWSHVEKGTSRQKAQPYIRPAFMQTRSGDLNSTVKPSGPHAAARDAAKRGR